MPDPEDILFGDLAVVKGYVTAEQVEECVENQKVMAEMGVKQRLGDVMVSKGYLTRDAQKDLLREQQRRTGKHIVIGPYEVVSKVGQGGMGAVYKAKVQETGAVVALKVLPKRLAADRDFVARFHREAKLASKLDHPNIVRAIQSGEHSGYHYFAMEFVAGETVGQRLKREGVIPEGEALRAARDVALALEHAAEAGMVHRDIKPDNIFLGLGGDTKLGDMGLAKEIDQEVTRITQTGMMVGTPHYVSPEQAQGERDIDVRSDIYSLGATLYHMVTGQTPFEGSTALAILNKHLNEELPWPADVNDDLTDDVCVLIQRMMAKDREDRYRSVLDLVHDIDLVIRGEEPTTDMLAIGKSSIRKAVRARKAGEASDRRRRRLEADARRGTHRAMSVAGVPSASVFGDRNWWLLWGGVGAAVAMVVAALAIVFSAGGEDDTGRASRQRTRREPRGREEAGPKLGSRSERAKSALGAAVRHGRKRPADKAGLIKRYREIAATYADLPEGKDAARKLERLKKAKAAEPKPRAGKAGPTVAELRGVKIVSVASRKEYQLSEAGMRAEPYIDRTLKITSIEPDLRGAVLVRTANTDRNVESASHLRIAISAPSKVYVCCDGMKRNTPSWLKDGTWKPLRGLVRVATVDTKVYAKEFPAGEFTLGGNNQGSHQLDENNYFVIVREGVEVRGPVFSAGNVVVKSDDVTVIWHENFDGEETAGWEGRREKRTTFARSAGALAAKQDQGGRNFATVATFAHRRIPYSRRRLPNAIFVADRDVYMTFRYFLRGADTVHVSGRSYRISGELRNDVTRAAQGSWETVLLKIVDFSCGGQKVREGDELHLFSFSAGKPGSESVQLIIDDFAIFKGALSERAQRLVWRPAAEPAEPAVVTKVPAPTTAGPRKHIDQVLSDFDSLAIDGDGERALKLLATARRDGVIGRPLSLLDAAEKVAAELAEARKARQGGFEAAIGKTVNIKVGVKRRRCKIVAVQEDAFLVEREVRFGTRVTTVSVKARFKDIDPEELEELRGGFTPETSDGHLAAALIAMGRNDFIAARDSLRAAGAHPLASRYRNTIEAGAAGAVPEAISQRRPAPRKAGPPVTYQGMNLGHAETERLGDGRLRITWEFDQPLDPNAWYLWNVLTDDAGTGEVALKLRGAGGGTGSTSRVLTPRVAFEGDVEVEAVFSGLDGLSGAKKIFPAPSVSMCETRQAAGAKRKAVGFKRLGGGAKWWGHQSVVGKYQPDGWYAEREPALKLVRRGSQAEFFCWAAGKGPTSLGKEAFVPGAIGVNVLIYHNWCTSYDAKLLSLTVVGKPAYTLRLTDPALSVPRKGSAAEQWNYALSIEKEKGRGSREALAAFCAQMHHYPRSIDQIGGSCALYRLAGWGAPGDAVAMWEKAKANFTVDDAVKSTCINRVGWAYWFLGRKEKAVRQFAIGRDAYASYSRACASTYFNFGDYDAAIREWERCLAKWPRDTHAPAVMQSIGNAYRKKGRPDQALMAYRKFAEKWPTDSRAASVRQSIDEIMKQDFSPMAREEHAGNVLADIRARYAGGKINHLAAHRELDSFFELYGGTRVAAEGRKLKDRIERGKPGRGSWYVVAGFSNEKKTGFAKEYPPEKRVDLQAGYDLQNGSRARWVVVPAQGTTVNLRATSTREHIVYYAFAYLYSARDQEATLITNSDDGMKLWLNGKVVVWQDVYGAIRDHPDKRTKVRLMKGPNPVLVKVTQATGAAELKLQVTGNKAAVHRTTVPAP